MKKSEFLRSIFIYEFIVILSTSCQTKMVEKTPDLFDTGVLSSQPCGPPCFWNITPGITSKNQVITILEDRKIYQNCKFSDATNGDNPDIVCESNIRIGFQQGKDIVEVIGFLSSQDITVSDFVTKYGYPDAVLVTPQGVPESPPSVSMVLYFDKINTRLVLPDQNSTTYELSPTVLIRLITYSERISYKEHRKYNSTNWRGYGPYGEYYNP